MVEFVIVLPIMLFLIFMIAYAGIGFERYSRVTNAARVAARAAAVARFDGLDPCSAAQDAADNAMHGLTVSMDECDAGSPGGLVTVTLSYTLPNIPVISSITGPTTVHGQGDGARGMRGVTFRLTHEERGQSIVLFVITFTALMGLLALVVNVGYWFQNQRRLQSVADATAMQAAQGDHDTFANISVDAPVAAQEMATDELERLDAHAIPIRSRRLRQHVPRAGQGLAQDRRRDATSRRATSSRTC